MDDLCFMPVAIARQLAVRVEEVESECLRLATVAQYLSVVVTSIGQTGSWFVALGKRHVFVVGRRCRRHSFVVAVPSRVDERLVAVTWSIESSTISTTVIQSATSSIVQRIAGI